MANKAEELCYAYQRQQFILNRIVTMALASEAAKTGMVLLNESLAVYSLGEAMTMTKFGASTQLYDDIKEVADTTSMVVTRVMEFLG